MAGAAQREVEIKLAVASAEEGRRRLEGAGFQVRKAREFESNVLFDTPEGRLRQARRLLRIRRSGRGCLLTYKGTPEPGKHKTREELEEEFAGGGALESILDRLGFVPVFRYEKYRTEYGRPAEEGVATLDETPIGVFVELEGSGGWIDAAARGLGFEEGQYILASYASLYQEHCAARGLAPGPGMVFAAPPEGP